MKTVTAIIETGADRRVSIYISDPDYPYGIIGTGDTVKDALQDFREGYEDMRETIEQTGNTFEEAEVVFRYDVPSFLQEFAYAFTLAGLQRITGINQKQLGHYVSGLRKPSSKTIRKMEEGIHRFCELLSDIHFAGA